MRSQLHAPSEFYRPRQAAKPASLFWVFLMLSPLFFARLFIGGTAVESYDDFGGVNLSILGYVAHIAILVYYVLLQRRQADVDGLMIILMVPLVLLSGIHAILIVNSNEAGSDVAMIAIIRSLLWIVCCIAIVGAASADRFLDAVLILIHVTFAIICVTVLIYYVTGIPINMIISRGVPRAQGMMSEPSGVASLLAGYIALAIAERKTKRILAGIVCALVVNSVIGILGVAIGIISGYLVRWRGLNVIRPVVQLVIFLAFPLFIILAPTLGNEISLTALDVMRYFDGTDFGQSSFYQASIFRMLQALSVMDVGLERLQTGDNVVEGGLFRFTSALLLVQDLTESIRGLFGFGLAAHAQLMLAQNRTILDFGLLTFLLSSFGLIIGPIGFLFLVYNLCASRTRLAVFAVPFSAVIMMNSAGGIHGYSIAIISALVLYVDRRRGAAHAVR
jgi:hypothetical protein